MRAMPALLTGLFGVLGLVSPASAQDAPPTGDGVDAHNFFPAAHDGDVRDPLTVQRVGGWSANQGFVGGILEYADAPMAWCVDETCSQQLNVVDNLVAFNLSGGYAPHDRVRIYFAAPLFIDSKSDVTYGGGAMGDIRLAGQVALLTDDGPVQAGVVPWIDLPTGNQDKFLGNSKIAGGASVAGSYETGILTLSGDVGMQFDPKSVANTDGANSVLVGLAVGVSPVDNWGLTAETRLEPSFIENPIPGTGAPSEMLYSARHKMDNGLHFTAGGGHAITAGVGAAKYRLFAGMGWESKKDPQPKDTDGDGIADKIDECRDEPETINGWKDMDGCPDSLGKLKVRVLFDGNPVEGADVIVKGPKGKTEHKSEATPVFEGIPGESWSAQATWNDCFAGKGDTKMEPGKNALQVELARLEGTLKVVVRSPKGEPVTDAFVKFLEPTGAPACHAKGESAVDGNGEHSVNVGTNVTHAFVVQAEDRSPQRFEATVQKGETTVIEVTMRKAKTKLSAERIDILEKVFFETGSDVILPESFELLEEVATVLIANPQVAKVQVAGHTDDKGDDQFNLELSQKRAESVRRWLIEHKVAAERLEAVGYGETKPIAKNNSEKGRAQNRRVEFVIMETAPNGDDTKE